MAERGRSAEVWVTLQNPATGGNVFQAISDHFYAINLNDLRSERLETFVRTYPDHRVAVCVLDGSPLSEEFLSYLRLLSALQREGVIRVVAATFGEDVSVPPQIRVSHRVRVDIGTGQLIELLHAMDAEHRANFGPRADAYLSRLHIHKHRCFRDTTLEIPTCALWTVCLGDNGTGKTTLLRALAATNSRPSEWRDEAAFELWVRFFDGREEPLFATPIAGPVCYGYGAGRGSRVRAVLSASEVDHCATLFDESTELPDPQEWYLRSDYGAALGDQAAMRRRDQIKAVLCNRLLPGIFDLRAQVAPQPVVEARTADGWIPLNDISFGYKSAMAWIVDMASRMFQRYPDSENPLAEPAIALIDEIDLHLHPRWQRQLLSTLSETFPRTQFIVTAHSPLIVQAAPNANIVLLRREGDRVVIVNDLDYIRQWRVDQILASDLFGQQPVHAPDVETVLQERRDLLRSGELGESDRNRLREIDAVLDQVPTSANPEDQKLLDTIRKAAADLGISVEP